MARTGGKLNLDQLPLILPESNWVPPTTLPRVQTQHSVAIDLECKDDGLSNDTGPGWSTGAGRVLGIAYADNQEKGYFSVERFGQERLRAWIIELFQTDTRIYMHNAPYDLGWLSTWDVPMPRRIEDTMMQAAMIDENRLEYGLDYICKVNGIPGKDEQLLREVCHAFGIPRTLMKANLWRLPEKFVAPYAEQDAQATLMLGRKQAPEIIDQELTEAYQLEVDLIPLWIEMRRRGIAVDVIKAEENAERLSQEVAGLVKELSPKSGFGRQLDISDLHSPESLERLFDNHSLPYPRTPKTDRGQFESDWMRAHPHWLPKAIANIRFRHMVAEKFLRNFVISFSSRGRIHSEIHPLRSDDGGTRSYRLSYSNPPLQQMSAGRVPGTEWVKPIVRGVFLPEVGERWFAPDYSQQEPRLTVHYAAESKVYGWEEAVDYYTNDPDADYHQMVADMAGITRKVAKIINLGLAYGMGRAKLAADLGMTLEEADRLFAMYHDKVPFVKLLTDKCASRVKLKGYIKLLDGARCRFDMWELVWREKGEKFRPPLPWDLAKKEWGDRRIRRAFTHKAMNRLIQGGAARQTKLAMRDCMRMGEIPLIQMHDELGFSLDSEKRGQRIADAMRGAVRLRVPVKVDEEYGHDWGDAKYKWSEL
jgi:DNA polymerase I-like protein with 3'-5' exonuclease and polymerase domains